MFKLKGKKVLILGLGKTGQSAARYAFEQGAKVTISDEKTRMDLAESVKSLADIKVDFDLGHHNPKAILAADIIILSPGVPSNAEGLEEARKAGTPVISDLELAFENIKCPIIAVTGTNGKTTTTALVSEMLKNDGKKVFTGGNIGTPILDMLIQKQTPDVVVVEVSSFQAESIFSFKPNVVVFTNLEPDHLDRYPAGLEAYYSAKKRLLQNADKNTTLVLNQENDRTAQLSEGFPGKVYHFTKKNPIQVNPAAAEKFQGAYLNRPKMILKFGGKEESCELVFSKLVGDHNKENIMAAAVAAKAVGCTRDAIQKTIDTFKGVAHRLEYIRKKDGVSFYNDSKATNVGSVIRSLNSFNASVILIAGGRDKDQDFAPLIELVKKRVKNLILVGEAKEKMNRIIGDFSETFLVGTFEEAVLLAYQKSRNTDIILLSPACASFDMFKNFEERGDYFKKLVAQL